MANFDEHKEADLKEVYDWHLGAKVQMDSICRKVDETKTAINRLMLVIAGAVIVQVVVKIWSMSLS